MSIEGNLLPGELARFDQSDSRLRVELLKLVEAIHRQDGLAGRWTSPTVIASIYAQRGFDETRVARVEQLLVFPYLLGAAVRELADLGWVNERTNGLGEY